VTETGAPAATIDAAPSGDGRPLDRRRARGLTLWSVLVLLMSPFSIPTFGMSGVLAVALVIVAGLLQWRGFDARRPMAAGIVAICLNGLSAGACSWLVLRTAEVTGIEAIRQEGVEQDFDRVFDEATKPPSRGTAVRDDATTGGDAGPAVDADSAAHREERR
jgi:hypothetical protein